MPNEPEQLDRDAMLMLYAADELSPDQRVALEAQLAADPALASELQLLQTTMSRAEDVLRELDATARLPVNLGVATRRAARAMQQWTIDRNRAMAEEPRTHRAMPWWIYPAAAAAVVIVGFLVWSGRQRSDYMPPPRGSEMAQQEFDDSEDLANRLDTTFDAKESTIEVAVDDSTHAELPADTDDGGSFFISPREELSP